MKKIFEFSVRQPMFVNLLTVLVVVAGIMALSSLNLDIFPNVSLDIVVVSSDYPGATPQEIEKLITIPIEKELKEVNDIKEMSSASIEGKSVIVLEIEPDAPDKRKVVSDIQRAVDRTEDLPIDLKEKPFVHEIEMRNHPVVEVSLSGAMSEVKLVRHARALESRLLDLPTIAKVARRGWREEEIWVEVDPAKVSSYRLSLADIASALKRRNVSVPGGTIVLGARESLLRTTGEFESAPEVERVVLRANEIGHWVQVKDVATVSENFEPLKIIHRTDGHRAVNLVAVKKEAADVIDVVDQIQAVVDDYRRIAPPELEINLVNDLSYYVKRRLGVLLNNGWISIILVLGCLFFFLSARVALVTALGIPLAFLTTFIVMYLTGITINLLTMFGLIMVLGMIVDDAIIIAENISRHVREGMAVSDAAIRGAHDIWRPVLTTVITTIAAFAPMMFMTGILGKFILYIPLVVVVALLASITEAFVMLPSHLVTVERLPHGRLLARLHTGWTERWFDRFRQRYVRLLRGIIRWRYPVFGGGLLFFLLSAYIGIFHIPFVLFPQRGIEIFFVRAKAQVGTPVEEMERLMKPLERLVAAIPKAEMDNFVTQVGVTQRDPDDPFAERATHIGQIVVYLKPQADRAMTADELIERLRKQSAGLGGLTELVFEKVRPGPPVGKPVEVRIKGDDLAELDLVAEEIKAFLDVIPGVSDVKDNYERGKDEIRVVVDEQQASRAGLSVEDVALAVRASFDGAIATTIKRSDEEIDVRVRYPDALRYRDGALEKVQIPNARGHLVPITAVARFERAPGITSIRHYDRKRTIGVTANVDEVQATSMDVTARVARHFADRAKDHPGVTISFGGEWEKTQESLDSLKIAMVIAAFVIFIVLAFQFQSMLQPLIVMVAVPYGFIGIIWAFLFHAEPKSFLAMVGAVGLAGIVVNNSIVLIDFINKAKAKGMSLREAIIEAAGLRLRPILLTTITTVFGLLPVAYGFLGSDPFLEPMALAIGWGLAFATCCTLLFTPCLYAVIDDVHRKVAGRITFWRNNMKNEP